MGLFKLLFGGVNRYEITCPKCQTKGLMYHTHGEKKGIFEIIDKTENGSLAIKECPNCHTKLAYDPLAGKVNIDQ